MATIADLLVDAGLTREQLDECRGVAANSRCRVAPNRKTSVLSLTRVEPPPTISGASPNK